MFTGNQNSIIMEEEEGKEYDESFEKSQEVNQRPKESALMATTSVVTDKKENLQDGALIHEQDEDSKGG